MEPRAEVSDNNDDKKKPFSFLWLGKDMIRLLSLRCTEQTRFRLAGTCKAIRKSVTDPLLWRDHTIFKIGVFNLESALANKREFWNRLVSSVKAANLFWRLFSNKKQHTEERLLLQVMLPLYDTSHPFTFSTSIPGSSSLADHGKLLRFFDKWIVGDICGKEHAHLFIHEHYYQRSVIVQMLGKMSFSTKRTNLMPIQLGSSIVYDIKGTDSNNRPFYYELAQFLFGSYQMPVPYVYRSGSFIATKLSKRRDVKYKCSSAAKYNRLLQICSKAWSLGDSPEDILGRVEKFSLTFNKIPELKWFSRATVLEHTLFSGESFDRFILYDFPQYINITKISTNTLEIQVKHFEDVESEAKRFISVMIAEFERVNLVLQDYEQEFDKTKKADSDSEDDPFEISEHY
jgi:hypothetical protein